MTRHLVYDGENWKEIKERASKKTTGEIPFGVPATKDNQRAIELLNTIKNNDLQVSRRAKNE